MKYTTIICFVSGKLIRKTFTKEEMKEIDLILEKGGGWYRGINFSLVENFSIEEDNQ